MVGVYIAPGRVSIRLLEAPQDSRRYPIGHVISVHNRA